MEKKKKRKERAKRRDNGVKAVKRGKGTDV